jgi:flagellar basal-body rod protein FlgF
MSRSLDVVANNVANVGTTGFRGDRVTFEEMIPPQQANANTDPEAVVSSRYVAVSDVVTDSAAGAIRQTGNPLDLALQGEGWFVINTPAGERYTRAGSFLTDSNGVLRTPTGHEVQGQDGRPIQVPTDGSAINIESDGSVRVDGNEVGQLRIARFADDNASLAKEGLTLFAPVNGAVATVAEDTMVLQGHLESSNMNAIRGMTELINATRSFDAFQKVIESFKQIDSLAATRIAQR